MRLGKVAFVLAALPVVLGGCGGGGTPGPTASAAGNGEEPWVVVATGSATPGPVRSRPGARRPPLPPVSFLPTDSACRIGWPDTGLVLIPMIVTPRVAALKVEWPAAYGPVYRITAVPQKLVTGSQPAPRWQTVRAGAGCTVTATITGLTSGAPYIVWLDAPETPRRLDGSRSLYSGKSAVVKPL